MIVVKLFFTLGLKNLETEGCFQGIQREDHVDRN